MKKVKLMLVSLSVLAVVGAALAFNVKGFTNFCSAAPIQGICPAACPNSGSGNLDGTQPFICTTPTSGVDDRPCKDAQGNTLTCTTSDKYLID